MDKTIFTIEEAQSFWGSPHNAKVALHRLLRKKMIAQIERGKYLIIPLEAGPTRRWTEDSFLVACALVQPSAIAYWSAIRHWNWTEQIPRIVYIQTPRRKNRSQLRVFGVEYKIVTVTPRKFYGHIKEWRKGKDIFITDKEKTIIDCADDVERAGGIEELSKAVRSACEEVSWPKLDEYIERFPNRSTMKRLGFLMELLGSKVSAEGQRVLLSWQQKLSAGIVPLDPGGRTTGRIVSRWRIKVNSDVE